MANMKYASYSPNGGYYEEYDNGTIKSGNSNVKLKQNYTTDVVTDAMKQAISASGGNPNGQGAADWYAEKLLNRVGTESANRPGHSLTLEDIQAELNRLGYKTNMSSANDSTTKQGATNNWMTIGGQQYLVGGQDYDWLKNEYNDLGLTNVNMYGGNTAKNYIPTNGNAIGRKSTPQELYQNAYEQALAQELERIEGLKAQAAQQQNDQNRRAYIAMRQGQKALANQAAASGLNDSGYSETSNVALMRDYGNNLNTINQDYLDYLANVDQNYTQTALQGAQYQYEQQLAALERARALEQQQYENAFKKQQYADAMAQQLLENEYREKTDQANYYADLYNAGQINASELAQAWANLGLIDGQYVRQPQVATPTERPTAPTATTYSDAVSALKQSGMDGASASNIYTASEFSRRKQAGGTWGGIPLSEFANYQEYLNSVQEFAKSK